MPHIKSTWKIKLAFFFTSLLFSLALCEVGLRMWGNALNASRPTGNDPVPISKPGGKVILCVGDSFTYGGLGTREDSYPAQLQEMIRQRYPKSNLTVINKGICETTSTELKEKLPRWIDSYQPDVIALLVGSADRFNAWHEKKEDTDIPGSWNKFFLDLRLIKMVRILYLNLKAKTLTWANWNRNLIQNGLDLSPMDIHERYLAEQKKAAFENSKTGALQEVWKLHAEGRTKEALQRGIDALKKDDRIPDAKDLMLAVTHFHFFLKAYSATVASLEDFKSKYSSSLLVHNALSYYLPAIGKALFREMKFDEAVDHYLQAIRLDPEEEPNYYWMAKAYAFQSRFDSQAMIRELLEIMEQHPDLSKSDMFNSYLSYFRNIDGKESKTNEKLRSNLKSIVAMCAKKSILLIFQSYPIEYPAANTILFDTAEKHCLPFLSHTKVFQSLTDIDKYILDDDHCTPLGHQLMAENMLNKMKASEMLGDSLTISKKTDGKNQKEIHTP